MPGVDGGAVGSVGFVDSSAYENTYAFALRDVLKDMPGVFVQNRYGQELRGSAQFSRVIGPLDIIATFSSDHASGYREHETGNYQQFKANTGYRFSPTLETRCYVGAYVVKKGAFSRAARSMSGRPAADPRGADDAAVRRLNEHRRVLAGRHRRVEPERRAAPFA